jgi:hypothetical protein
MALEIEMRSVQVMLSMNIIQNMSSAWFVCVTENIQAYDDIITVLGCCTM